MTKIAIIIAVFIKIILICFCGKIVLLPDTSCYVPAFNRVWCRVRIANPGIIRRTIFVFAHVSLLVCGCFIIAISAATKTLFL